MSSLCHDSAVMHAVCYGFCSFTCVFNATSGFKVTSLHITAAHLS